MLSWIFSASLLKRQSVVMIINGVYIFTAGLQTAFSKFGPFKIEWPGKDGMFIYYLLNSNLPACYH
jgi:hypothetical protein